MYSLDVNNYGSVTSYGSDKGPSIPAAQWNTGGASNHPWTNGAPQSQQWNNSAQWAKRGVSPTAIWSSSVSVVHSGVYMTGAYNPGYTSDPRQLSTATTLQSNCHQMPPQGYPSSFQQTNSRGQIVTKTWSIPYQILYFYLN